MMKITKIEINELKRFTNLTIQNIPVIAKLVVLVGPNGCGKSSLFDVFKCWQLYHGFNNVVNDENYYTKEIKPTKNAYDNVSIYFDDGKKIDEHDIKYGKAFYFRTAYRNEPEFTTNQLNGIGEVIQAEHKCK